MASIRKRPNGTWRARYRDERGREYARHFDRKTDAQHWLDEITTQVRTGLYVDPNAARITVAEWSQQYLDTKVDLKATTHERYAGLLRVQVLPTWGHVALGDVSHSGIARWVADLDRSGLSASTVRQAYRVFSLTLTLAVRDGRLARNPAEGVPLPRIQRSEKVFLTVDQVENLADAAGDNRAAMLFLAYTGVRFGELAALRVGRLDLDRRRAHIVEAMAEVHGQAVFSTPKTHQTRSVPIPRSLVADLEKATAGKSADDFVFTAPRGGVLRLQNFRHHVFDPAVRAAGLEGLTPHGLRHTAASLAITSGADVKVVQQMLGHASATMTLDLYGHLYGDRLDEVADRMDVLRASRRISADRVRTEAQQSLFPGIDL